MLSIVHTGLRQKMNNQESSKCKYAGIKGSLLGEDTYLRDCMQRKYKCVDLRCVGAIDFGIALHDNATYAVCHGKTLLSSTKALWQALVAAFVYYHPDNIAGYFYEKERARKGLVKIGDVV